MPKKVTIPVVAAVLLLTIAPLVLAQEDAAQPAQEAQTTAPDQTQQDATQAQYAQGAQPALPDLSGLMRLNENNNLVVDCGRVSERLAQLNQLGETQGNDPLFQAALARVDDLAQLCADGGYTPPGAAAPTAPAPPSAAGESTTPTPSTVETSDASNPNGTVQP